MNILAIQEVNFMSNPHDDATNATRSWCPYCGCRLNEKGICWNCYDLQNAEPPDDVVPSIETLKAYRGGRWVVDELMKEGVSEGEAIADAQNAVQLQNALSFGTRGLVGILADQYATETLRQLIIAKDERILNALSVCVERLLHPEHRSKRGPAPKADGHIEQKVLRLRREGKQNPEIATMLETTPRTVAAAYSNITDKIAEEQRQGRDNISDR